MFEGVLNKLKGMKVVEALVNYSHTTIAVAYAVPVLVCELRGIHVSANFVSFTYAFYGFLLGHAGVYQKWPDQDQAPPDVPKI